MPLAVHRLAHPVGARRGFTLVEILIVGALIVLFSGLAIINMQRFFEDSARKAMFAEARELATALSFAHDDLGYYPRIYTLGLPLNLVTFTVGTQTVLRPGFDAYGYFAFVGAVGPVAGVVRNWRGPYAGLSANRTGSRMLVRMRLTDVSLTNFPETIGTENLRVVLWPADRFGNPWMYYGVVTDVNAVTANNPLGLRLINSPSEEANFFNAVVSYGQNGVPGGNNATARDAPGFLQTVLEPAMLYVRGDVAGGTAEFSLKSFASAFAATQINPATFNPLLAQSIRSGTLNEATAGITDAGSDDIFIRF